MIIVDHVVRIIVALESIALSLVGIEKHLYKMERILHENSNPTKGD